MAELDRSGEAYRAEDVHAWARRVAGSGEPAAQAVAQTVHSARAIENLEHAFGFLLAGNPPVAVAAAAAIESAVSALAAHPLLGRRVEEDLRELVISFGATGYIGYLP